MIRTLLLAAFALPISASVLAQEFSTTFIPYGKVPSDGQSQMVKTVLPPMATDEYAVAWEFTGATEKNFLYSALVLDRATNKEVNRGTIPMPHEDCTIIVEEVFAMGKDACIIYRAHHKKDWHVTLYALRLSLPDLKPVGELVKLAYHDLDKNLDPSYFVFNIEPSPDGSKWGVLMYTHIKKELDYTCWMLDGQWAPLWQHNYKLSTEADVMRTRSVHVTDAGELFLTYAAYYKAQNNAGSWLAPEHRHPSFVGRVDASGSTMKPLDVGNGLRLTAPCLVPVKDGFLVGGVVGDPTAKSKGVQVGTMVIGDDLAVRSGPETVAVPGLKPEQTREVNLYTNGTTTWLFLQSDELLTCLVGEGTSIQKVGGKIPFIDYHSTLTFTRTGSVPAAAIFEQAKNFEAMSTGESPKVGLSYNLQPGIIHWDASGKASVKPAITKQDGYRDISKVTPRIGMQWISEGLLVDQLTGKGQGIVLIELK